jgi:hypothetical protein
MHDRLYLPVPPKHETRSRKVTEIVADIPVVEIEEASIDKRPDQLIEASSIEA